jgi:sensor c-di-GMP phosphodiesterase-like protein
LVAGLVSPDAAERRFTFSSQASQGLLQVVAIVTKAPTEIGFLDSSYEFCEQLDHGESRRTTLRMARECRRFRARLSRSADGRCTSEADAEATAPLVCCKGIADVDYASIRRLICASSGSEPGSFGHPRFL